MSSVYSMPEDDDPPRRFPWRIVLCLLCLLGAALYTRQAVPPILDDYQAELRGNALSWAGLLAEGVEQQFTDDVNADAPTLASAVTPVFDQESSLAYARIWDTAGHVRYSYARGQSNLPEMGFAFARRRAEQQMAAPGARETVAHLQELLLDQGELTDTMQRAVDEGKGSGAHSGLYVREDDLARLAGDMTEDHPLLKDAADEMHLVLDALTRNDATALAEAAKASGDAESDLTLALEDFRAVIDEMPTLPDALQHAVPPPTAWWQRLFPAVHLRRVLVPIYIPATNDVLVESMGTAEIGIYERPVELAARLASHCWPADILLLAAVAFVIPWRRKAKGG